MLYAMWGAMGWCGTPYPGWWRGPHPPGPDPEPWWLVKIASIVGGLVGGWVTQGLVGGLDVVGAAAVLTSFVGAYAGGAVLGGITGIAGAGKRATGA